MTVSADEIQHTELDRHFARFISRIGGGAEAVVLSTAASLSHAVREGHICLDLGNAGMEPQSRKTLLECSAIGAPDKQTPLVLDEAGRLYLRRYWLYEKRLAEMLLAKSKSDNKSKQKSQ